MIIMIYIYIYIYIYIDVSEIRNLGLDFVPFVGVSENSHCIRLEVNRF